MIRIRTSKRQSAKERRMERRLYAHPRGRVRVIARRVVVSNCYTRGSRMPGTAA